ncbi:3-dehydroquinate synthase [Geosporobacter ferrireducens]|uniref:3-dehydroquinate synthase n=1 Tax=Geosporobacter ferrireducens TaxID=1424294 RepID=A0A1D8GHY9_9FIRM|nr:3-dehydroquinate synthase [Geosporobacter ferrireducens]AOT70490.1 3-dehydroquinate synthase [Geosporobacter ferrireducens]
MESLQINLGERSYSIYIGTGLFSKLDEFKPKADRYLLLTDENVDAYYGEQVMAAVGKENCQKYVIEPGESSKTMETVTGILSYMLDQQFTRKSALIALGGGVVGDIAGFCASVYMRGIEWIQLPTTLLAQVDSSVGGKTGVNMPQGKNVVGSFYQPQAVVIDIDVLKSLPKREMVSGIGEVIKYGIICDYDFFSYMNKNLYQLFTLKKEVLEKVIYDCCRMKAVIVAADEREGGLRKILNFGHTFGHSLEAATNYEKYTHGEAVLIGMSVEAKMAWDMGWIDRLYYEEIKGLIEKTGISLDITNMDKALLLDKMMGDKKNQENKISFILPIEKGGVKEVMLQRDAVKW